MKRNCPRDRALLVERRLEGVTVDECPECQGAYFDAKEVGAATGDKELAKYLGEVHGAASSPMVCPACGHLMDLDRIDGVEIDHCIACLGVWLDAGELEKLAARGEGALGAGADAKAKASESRHYDAMPRGGGGGRFAGIGHAFALVAWKLRRRR